MSDGAIKPFGYVWKVAHEPDKWHFAMEAVFSSWDIERGLVHSITPLFPVSALSDSAEHVGDELKSLRVELSSSQARLSEAVKVMEKANTALNDWLNIYAPDMCEENRVAEAHKRVSEYGTIAYIADVTAEIRSVLATLGEENE